MNGGTGITKKDVTIEAVNPLFAKTLTGFGPLFAKLSFDEIGSAAFLSRATAGVIEDTVVFCMPGSLNACKLACRELIFPELGHLVKHVDGLVVGFEKLLSGQRALITTMVSSSFLSAERRKFSSAS